MSEALREIKAQLGPDAMILSTKEVPRRSGAWGASSGFEVVAAIDDSEAIDDFSHSSDYEPESKWAPYSRKSFEMQPGACALNSRSEAGAILDPLRSGSSEIFADSEEQEISGEIPLAVYHDLLSSGVEDQLVRTLLTDALKTLVVEQRRSRSALLQSISEAAKQFIPSTSAFDGMPEKKVVAFIGPAGVGKTTSLAKLAARLSLQKKKKVILMTTDGRRI